MEETGNALESLLPFTESEKEYLDRLLNYGEIKPALLTSDEGLAERFSPPSGRSGFGSILIGVALVVVSMVIPL